QRKLVDASNVVDIEIRPANLVSGVFGEPHVPVRSGNDVPWLGVRCRNGGFREGVERVQAANLVAGPLSEKDRAPDRARSDAEGLGVRRRHRVLIDEGAVGVGVDDLVRARRSEVTGAAEGDDLARVATGRWDGNLCDRECWEDA